MKKLFTLNGANFFQKFVMLIGYHKKNANVDRATFVDSNLFFLTLIFEKNAHGLK